MGTSGQSQSQLEQTSLLVDSPANHLAKPGNVKVPTTTAISGRATGLPLIAFDFEQIPFDKLAKLEKLVKQHDDIRIEKVIAFIK